MTRYSLIFLLASPLLLTLPSFAAAPVGSPVGFVEIRIPSHSSATVSVPFVPANPSIESVLADQLIASTNLSSCDRVLLWDSANNRYRTAAKLLLSPSSSETGSGSVWTEISVSTSGVETILGPVGSDFRIEPGAGFVLINRQDKVQTVRIAGQVITDSLRSIAIPAGASLVGFPYTTAKPAGETRLAESGNILTTNAFRMGEGAWVQSDTNGLWSESHPYSNPFSLSNTPVRIADLVFDHEKAILDIQVSDPTVKSIDLLTLDLAHSDVVSDWMCNWTIAATNINVANQTQVSWSDDLTVSSASFRGVRLYLVLQSGVPTDLGCDGVSSLARTFLRQAAPGSPRSTAVSTTPPLPTVVSSVAGVLDTTPNQTSGNQVNAKDGPRLVFVDIKRGDDSFTGFTPVVTAGHGPKKKISTGVRTVSPGGTVVVQDGQYTEDIDVAGKPVNIHIRGNVILRK